MAAASNGRWNPKKVRSIPRRAAKITQGEIAGVIRAAREAGAAEAIIDGEGQIRVVLPPNVPAASTSSSEEDDQSPTWTRSALARKERWSSRDATSWCDIPKHLKADPSIFARFKLRRSGLMHCSMSGSAR